MIATATDRPVSAARLMPASSARPIWRMWDGETVVHHALSNDTHRLATPAGLLLGRLAELGPQTPDALAAACGIALDDAEAALDALIDLRLVEWC